jgi:hypothetical protein
MRFSLSVALLAFLLPLVAHCQTVFISKTCNNNKNIKEWKDYWGDFRLLSELGATRLASPTDTDFHAVFTHVTFSRTKSPDFR